MWALQHLHQSQFMDELQLLDAPKAEGRVHAQALTARVWRFRFVVLVGSLQDSYVPLHTAQATIPAAGGGRQEGRRRRVPADGHELVVAGDAAVRDGAEADDGMLTLDYRFAQT